MIDKCKPTISAIVAISENFAIGKDNMIPWHLPDDLKYFRNITIGHTVIMGRKTFDSIGKALPLRINIVVTNQPKIVSNKVFWVNSITQAISLAQSFNETKVFIIGGGQIYEQSKELWHRMYITKVNTIIPNADAFFPHLEETDWNLISDVTNQPDRHSGLKSKFLVYDRIRKH